MNSWIRTEFVWFGRNYLLLNGVAFFGWLAYGAFLVSKDGSIPGFGGTPIEQVFWFAFGSVAFTTAIIGVPILAIALVLWRLVVRVSGHPRAVAFAGAGLASIVAIVVANPQGIVIALLAAVLPAFVYAGLARLPPATE
jgi:hypothetical protein